MEDVNERLARILDGTGDFRILRRVPTPPSSTMSDADRAAAGLATGIVLDTETIGLGPEDEVIELGMVRFAFEPTILRIDHVVDSFSAFREPTRPIPPDVRRLTGITDADVAGRAIDPDAVAAFAGTASVVIAHNAGFDRPFVERAWPLFADLAWACSLEQVDWRAEGFEGRRLGQLLAERHLFHDGHRALDDCIALLHLLRLPVALGATPFELVMREAVSVTVRIWAIGSPFEVKGKLKSRGYRWDNGDCRGPRAWWRVVPERAAEAEVAWLRAEVYDDPSVSPLSRRLTPQDRFSVRADAA